VVATAPHGHDEDLVTILVTGAAGFVGSHFARAAHDAGHRVVAIDDLSTSSRWPRLPEAIEQIQGDVGDRALVTQLVTDRDVGAIVHFAGRIRVDESVRDPALYFEQNLTRTIALIDAATFSSKKALSFILSSSAAVYGQPERSPIVELSPPRPISPYGASKLAAEIVLEAYGRTRGVRWAALRYFNAAGAHPDGLLREMHDPETHLIPLAIDAALGVRSSIAVFGNDYPTKDGTCIRDYVHVMDLAEAHLAALFALDRGVTVGVVNLGSGCGYTVREVLAEVAASVGRPVPHVVTPRRLGDPSNLTATVTVAEETLGWQPRRGLGQIVLDAYRSRRLVT
jgi:UDP-glucose-4-epimerase GalE